MQGSRGTAFLSCSLARGAEQEVERRSPPGGWREGKQDCPGQAESSLEEHSWCNPTQIFCQCLKAVTAFPIPIQPRPPSGNSKVLVFVQRCLAEPGCSVASSSLWSHLACIGRLWGWSLAWSSASVPPCTAARGLWAPQGLGTDYC